MMLENLLSGSIAVSYAETDSYASDTIKMDVRTTSKAPAIGNVIMETDADFSST